MAKNRKHGTSPSANGNGTDHGANIQLAFSDIKKQHVENVLAQYQANHYTPEIKEQATEIRKEFKDAICNKTGATLTNLRTHSSLSVEELIIIHGEERAKQLVSVIFCQNVTPSWVYCDNEALGSLAIHDPIGYYIYALGLIFDFSEPTVENIKFKNALWIELFERNSDNILRLVIETNEWLRRALFIFNKKQLTFYASADPDHTIDNVLQYMPVAILPVVKDKLRKIASTSIGTGRNLTLSSVTAQKYTNLNRYSAFGGNSLTRQKSVDYELADLLLAFDSLLPTPSAAAEVDLRTRQVQAKLDNLAVRRKAAAKIELDHTAPLPSIRFGKPSSTSNGNGSV